MAHRNPAPVEHPIHDLFIARRSGRAFSDAEVSRDVVLRLFEAARWAPSSANEQPWRFVVATRGEAHDFARFIAALNPGNQAWASRAALVGVAAAHRTLQRNGEPNRWAWYDTGQAVAFLTVQATNEGLMVHQMAGFDAQRMREAAAIPDDHDPVVAFVIGVAGDPAVLDEVNAKRELAPRTRRPLVETVFAGRWGSRIV